MREVNVMDVYKNTKITIRNNLMQRKIKDKILASYRGKDFFDGDRTSGYGGLIYDGRWNGFAHELIRFYELGNKASILQINSEKGFLLFELYKLNPELKLHGIDWSDYAIGNSLGKDNIKYVSGEYTVLPYENSSMDLVISLGNVYCFNLHDAIKHLKEIERVKVNNSLISLATYETNYDYDLFKKWSLLGTLLLKRDEWREVLEHAGYSGDYQFIDAKYLGLLP